MISKNRPQTVLLRKKRNGFDLIAPFYDFFATVFTLGNITRSQKWGLDQLPKGGRVLILGGGTGKTLPLLIGKIRPHTVWFVDSSEKMLQKAAKRLNAEEMTDNGEGKLSEKCIHGRKLTLKSSGSLSTEVYFSSAPEFHQLMQELGLVNGAEPNGSFDLVITPYYLDLFGKSLPARMEGIGKILSSNGFWHFSDFGQPVNYFPGLAAGLYVRALYVLFNSVCGIEASQLPDFQEVFKKIKVREMYAKNWLGGMLQTRIFQKEKT